MRFHEILIAWFSAPFGQRERRRRFWTLEIDLVKSSQAAVFSWLARRVITAVIAGVSLAGALLPSLFKVSGPSAWRWLPACLADRYRGGLPSTTVLELRFEKIGSFAWWRTSAWRQWPTEPGQSRGGGVGRRVTTLCACGIDLSCLLRRGRREIRPREKPPRDYDLVAELGQPVVDGRAGLELHVKRNNLVYYSR